MEEQGDAPAIRAQRSGWTLRNRHGSYSATALHELLALVAGHHARL
jgi:hypothetical protein